MTVRQVSLRLSYALFWRYLLAMALWWVLAEGDPIPWGIASLFSLLAALSSLKLMPASSTTLTPRQLIAWLRFIPFFLWQSLLGGLDVAQRAFRPHMPLQPDIIVYPLRLATGWPQIFFLNTISLLPGSLAVRLDGNQVHIHLLDGRGDPQQMLRQVEARVSLLFACHETR